MSILVKFFPKFLQLQLCCY